MLVVAADDSVMPQTREHLEILRLLGLAGGVVVLTKCDLADAAWLALVEDDVRALVAGTFLEVGRVVRTSADDRPGDRRRCKAAPRPALRRGPRPAPTRACSGWRSTARSPSPGTGRSSRGRSPRARSAVGDELEWLPEGRTVRVRGLHRHDRPVDRVGRGPAGGDQPRRASTTPRSRRGHELADARLPGRRRGSSRSRSGRRPTPPGRSAIGRRYRLHLGTAEVAATLALLGPASRRPGRPAWPSSSWPSRSRPSTASRS